MWRVARSLAVIYLVVLLMMMLLERRLIFFPTRHGNWNPAGLTFEDAYFEASDGTSLHGWYVPHPQARAVLLIAHGNAGNLADRAWLVDQLNRRLQVGVMIFDYRGYGRSEGTPDEAGILADARAARAWLAARLQMREQDIVLMGRSLGSGVMVDLAAKEGARGLILDSAFTSLPDVAAHHYPFFPVRWVMRTRLDSLSKIGEYHGPLLQTHGEADRTIPIELGRKLFDAAAASPKRFVVLPDTDHNDALPPEYFEALRWFIDQLPPLVP
jgi:fermentation-respiration switch protein FrsA (DUF1100 family)